MNIVPIINTNDAVVPPPEPNSDLQGVNVGTERKGMALLVVMVAVAAGVLTGLAETVSSKAQTCTVFISYGYFLPHTHMLEDPCHPASPHLLCPRALRHVHAGRGMDGSASCHWSGGTVTRDQD